MERLRALCGLLLLVLTAGCEPDCPAGTHALGSGCQELADEAEDAGSVATCGDGVRQANEACDDGNLTANDGCEPTCQLTKGYACKDTVCQRLPATPLLQGLESSDPDHVVWQWQVAEGESVEVTLDGKPQAGFMGSGVLDQALPEGKHTLTVRACNDAGCSALAKQSTVAKRHGADYGRWYRAVQRPITRTALGAVAALICTDCYSSTDADMGGVDATAQRIATSLLRGSDFIHLPIVAIAGELYVSHDDARMPGQAPKLVELLARSEIRTSDAPIQLELRETDSNAQTFAELVLNRLADKHEVVRNGRPLLVQLSGDDAVGYLAAMATAAKQHPLLAPYLRYWRAMTGPADLADWLKAVQDDALHEAVLDGVLLDYREPSLFSRIAWLHQKGLGVWIMNLPGPGHGEFVLAGLREAVDGVVTAYRIDQAKAIFTSSDSIAYASSATLDSVAARSLPVRSVASGMDATTLDRTLGIAPVADTLGTPNLLFWGEGNPLIGGVLDFSPGKRELALTDKPLDLKGIFVSVIATLGSLDLEPQSSRLVVGSNPVLSLGLNREAQGPVTLDLRFFTDQLNVYAYPASGGDVTACPSPDTAFVEPLTDNRAYWLMAAYDGQGGVQFLIDGRCAGAVAPAASGAFTLASQPALGMLGGFLGVAQGVQVLHWQAHDQEGTH